MRRKRWVAGLGVLALGVLLLGVLSRPVVLRARIWGLARDLGSEEASCVEGAFQAMLKERDPLAWDILLRNAETTESRQAYYQIVRLVFALAEAPFTPENEKLPSVEDLRVMVKGKFDSARKPYPRNP